MANLRPFQKGVSGNPSGISKGLAELRALARANTTPAFSKLIDLMQSRDERVAFMAAKEILDRGWGRPTPAADESDDRTVVVNLVQFAQSPSSSS